MSYVSWWIFVATLVFVPFFSGSIGTVWTPVWCATLGAALASAPVTVISYKHLKVLTGPIFLFLAFAIVALLQVLPNPTFAPVYPLWSQAEQLLGFPITKHLGVGVFQAILAAGRPLAMFLAFFCAFIHSVERERSILLMKITAAAAAAYAIYGLVILFYDLGGAFWSGKAVQLQPLHEPFVNRNHAATYFGSGAVICLTFLISRVERAMLDGAAGLRHALGQALQNGALELAATIGCLGLCLTATFLTFSRAGILATISGLAVSSGLYLYRLFSAHRKLPLILGAAVVAGAIFVEVAGGDVAYRLGSEGLVDFARLQTYRSTLRMIEHYPWFGTGLGSFTDVFPEYRSALGDTRHVWDHAHSTPLELAADMGIPLAVLTALVGLVLGYLLISAALRGGRGSWVAIAAFGVFILGTLHSLVDFSLQIPGYGIIFSSVLGCGLARCVPARGAGSRPSRRSNRRSQEKSIGKVSVAEQVAKLLKSPYVASTG